MSDSTDPNDPNDPYLTLARLLRPRDRPPASLAGATGAGGSGKQKPSFVLPVGGLEGQVLTLVEIDGGLLVQWADAPGSGTTGNFYRALVYDLDGLGSFEFLTDLDGHPIYELAALEPGP